MPKKKRKVLSTVNFENGARMRVIYKSKVPPIAAEAHDHYYVSLEPAKRRGKKESWFMNAYDMTNLVWALATAVAHSQELGLPPK